MKIILDKKKLNENEIVADSVECTLLDEECKDILKCNMSKQQVDDTTVVGKLRIIFAGSEISITTTDKEVIFELEEHNQLQGSFISQLAEIAYAGKESTHGLLRHF